MSDTRKYQGYNMSNGQKIVIVTGDEPDTMTMIQEDGSMKEVPYHARRTGELKAVPQMPEGFTGFIVDNRDKEPLS